MFIYLYVYSSVLLISLVLLFWWWLFILLFSPVVSQCELFPTPVNLSGLHFSNSHRLQPLIWRWNSNLARFIMLQRCNVVFVFGNDSKRGRTAVVSILLLLARFGLFLVISFHSYGRWHLTELLPSASSSSSSSSSSFLLLIGPIFFSSPTL